MRKCIRTALLAIALFLGSLAAVGAVGTTGEGVGISPRFAQSAGPGEVWYAYVVVKKDEKTQALFVHNETFKEKPECNQAVAVMQVMLGMRGAEVVGGWCDTKTPAETVEEAKKNAGDPA